MTVGVPRRRGFSIVEAVIVLVVAAVLVATVVLTARPGERAAGDAVARNRLEQVVDVAEEVRNRNGAVATDLAVYDAALPDLTLTAGAPSAGEVSLAVADGALGAAVAVDDGSCFFIRRDWAAAPGEPLVVRALTPPSTGVACTGATALAVDAAGRGRSWDDPTIVEAAP